MNQHRFCVMNQHRFAAAALLALALAGCGDDAAGPPVFDLTVIVDMAQPILKDMTITSAGVVMVGPGNVNAFVPSTVTIMAGQSVTWNWVSGTHGIVSDDTPSSFSPSPVQSSGQYTLMFANAGTFGYHCSVHGTMMSGTIVVK